jgi:hypothetical protein
MHWLSEETRPTGDDAAVLLVLQAHRSAWDRPSTLEEVAVGTGINDPAPVLQRLAEQKHALPINGHWATR